MPNTGAGPSRRSHTKSRKGCKTCKRRHIRCDETFPQCRNCTKHQVRCDYSEGIGSDTESQRQSPEQPSVMLTPGSESRIRQWEETNTFPYPALEIFPPPQTQEYSKNELRLIHHLSSMSNDLLMKGTSDLTVWTTQLPRFLRIASSYPYVMHALLSFSANHLAWVQSSAETRSMSLHHGSIALRGLHEAIGNFSIENADAVLAASLLLLWQATDYRSWASLRAGIQSVLGAMHSWGHNSVFAEHIVEEDLLANAFRTHRRKPSMDVTDRASVLTNVAYSLHRLQMTIGGQELESGWVSQLASYIQQLQALEPSLPAEEQFNCLYQLRKWMFWVPVSLLQQQDGHGPALLTIAHFYATALALEPLFLDLGSSFCSAMALGPLEAIVNVTDAMRSEHGMDSSAMEIASLMQFPRQTAMDYRTRAMQSQASHRMGSPMLNVEPDTFSYTTIGNLSPAFTPSAPHYTESGRPLSTHFLEVPSQASFTYGTQTWGAQPSPGFPPHDFPATATEEHDFGGMSLDGLRGGIPPRIHHINLHPPYQGPYHPSHWS
ncbi:Hypothetical protein R9X50_00640000 [Acrodontium crateriforme]|uniref:Zn(2)-C6 fungal-type domain-containing protein n=1 Tax=Acrodontium crateriforme TaxID=150365 RepID=A0AAQ3M925_9PEZI|nr:Hypothetical protein R9X50_00640000 [Acrodontium crateriforme]